MAAWVTFVNVVNKREWDSLLIFVFVGKEILQYLVEISD